MNSINETYLLKVMAVVVFAIFLGACLIKIPLEWYSLDLTDTWHKSFFENGTLAFRSTFCLVVLTSILPVLGGLNALSLIDRETSMAKLMLLELLLTSIIAGLLFVYFREHYNLAIYFYDSTLNAMFTGGMSGLCLAWLGRFVFYIPFHYPRYYSYR